jgi:hypothetical protein
MKTFHGKSNTRLHNIWKHMRGRCNNPNNTSYSNYGGRGISVCQEWNDSFNNFYDWATNNGYSDDLSIDRIDVNGNYEPSNCRWATNSTQSANTRQIHKTNKSGYRGVSWNTAYSKWEVSICINKVTIKIGYYTDVLEAAKAYDTYILDNQLEHTTNSLLSDGERVESNVGQTLISSNTSGYRGVSSPKRISHLKNPWTSALQYGGKKIWSGYFPTALDAAVARDIHIRDNDLPHIRNFSDEELNSYCKEPS